jgi:hypothetical protein
MGFARNTSKEERGAQQRHAPASEFECITVIVPQLWRVLLPLDN